MITFTAMPLIIKTNNFLILPFVTAMDIKVTLKVFKKNEKITTGRDSWSFFTKIRKSTPLNF